MINGHSALSAIFLLHEHTAIVLHGPGMPSRAQAPHPRHPSSLAPKCTQLSCCPARAGPSPFAAALPACGCPCPSHHRISSTPSSAAYITCHFTAPCCEGMSCNWYVMLMPLPFKEQSLPLHCYNTFVKASSIRPSLVQQSAFRLVPRKTLADVLILHSCQIAYSAHHNDFLLGQSHLSKEV